MRFLSIYTLVMMLAHSALAAAPGIKIWTATTTGDSYRVKITLEPNPANRFVCFYVTQIQGGGEQKASCWSVQAEREARTTWKEVRDLNSGRWIFRAAVLRADESSELSNEIEAHVFGPNYQSSEP